MNALIATKWFTIGGVYLAGGGLAWLRTLNLLTGRRAQGIPRGVAALAVIPLTLPGMAGLWYGVGTLAD